MANCKPCATPTSCKAPPGTSEPYSDPTFYRQLMGSLHYFTHTRPDLAYAVGVASQHLHQPTDLDHVVVKRILRYIQGTLSYGLFFSRGSLQLCGFSDADWAGNSHDRSSINGNVVFINNNLVS
ncbi:hypothetical protein J5N97_024853 [Dioscorea zingiberensis]|uniref:Mitochondrial protein n=1 Tax=Dioscorea zingiberensis TaxID=325984 RepID=A0A9D5H8Z9_9LILI|nr:hypothetical protein J5N97_024853 [Dioscorea zingiberensis]